MNYDESVKYLYDLGHEVLAAKYGLENIEVLIEALDRPDRAFPSVLVAGTNGKGSVAAMIESGAREAGLRTGLLTSPHLVRIEERIALGGASMNRDDFARIATRTRRVVDSLVSSGALSGPATFFEQVTAMALEYYREASVDLAVLEVGLGGRLDATNVADRVLSVISCIDYDHQSILGNSIEEIATEKTAIVRRGSRAVIGRQIHAAANEAIRARCSAQEVSPVFAGEARVVCTGDRGTVTFDYESARRSYRNLSSGLLGRHQADNAAAAVEALETLDDLGFSIGRDAIVRGLRNVKWRGRLELWEGDPPILLDGAHNVGGAQALRGYLTEFWDCPITLVFGVMGDKEIERICDALLPLAETVILTRVPDRRAAPPYAIRQLIGDRHPRVLVSEDAASAISEARKWSPRDGLICVAGSLHLVGEVRRLLLEEDEARAVGG